ncbi:MAG: hypothetical protein JW940_23625 [Polyangiaceae bacterium]|nr:hypothetical protein [Polyangiaceae bacterium]
MALQQLPADFEPSGLLRPGIFLATLAELRCSLLVQGTVSTGPGWRKKWRLHLVDQLELLVRDLWHVGIDQIFANGSFCTDKPRPGDIDGYFVTSWLNWRSQAATLRVLRPEWTWAPREMRPAADGKPKLPMWHEHRVELFPVFDPPFRDQSFLGTRTAEGKVFIDDFFQLTRSHESKGIVQIARDPQP